MNAPAVNRRGACPGLTAPMPTGDGLLVRFGTAGTIGLEALRDLCAAARRHGNGIIEVTARGSVQVRGLSAASAPAFAETIAALDIAAAGISILADPLAGLAADEAADGNALALAIALRLRLVDASFVTGLGPKVAVVIDGGCGLHLDAVVADIRLRAERVPDGVRFHVGLGGDALAAASIGAVAATDAIEAVVRLLAVLAHHGPAARARALLECDGSDPFKAAIADCLRDAAAPPARPPAEPIGTHRLRDGGCALGIGVAFGHTDADALEGLALAAQSVGARGIRAAPGRTLLIIGLMPKAAPSLAEAAERFGFITRRDDPRRHVVACAGAPVCASAKIRARALAPTISTAAAALLDGSLTIHVSGCPKGCAHPGAAALTIVGGEHGCDLVAGGTARAAPLGTVATEHLPASVALLAGEVERLRRPGECAATALARLDLAAILGASSHG